jgi:hypothetical protein
MPCTPRTYACCRINATMVALLWTCARSDRSTRACLGRVCRGSRGSGAASGGAGRRDRSGIRRRRADPSDRCNGGTHGSAGIRHLGPPNGPARPAPSVLGGQLRPFAGARHRDASLASEVELCTASSACHLPALRGRRLGRTDRRFRRAFSSVDREFRTRRRRMCCPICRRRDRSAELSCRSDQLCDGCEQLL